MSTNRDTSPAFHSFVFKLKLAGASSREEHRRYGFVGDLRQPAVFSGLCTRTTQVFKLAPGSFHLATIDRLGRQVSVNTHDDFLRHVCKPTLSYQNLNTVKLDAKGRIVLHFHVVRLPQPSANSATHVKGSEMQPQSQEQAASTGTLVDVSEPASTSEISGTIATGLLIDVSSSDSAANPEQTPAARSSTLYPPAVPVSAVGSGALPPPTHYHHSHPHEHGLHRHNEFSASCRPSYNPYTSPARHRHQHGSGMPPTTTPMVSYGPTAHVSAMIHRLERRRQLHEQTMRESSSAASSSHAPPAASTSALASADEKTAEPAKASNGYTPAYVTDVPITEKAETEAEASSASPKLSPPSSPVAETWTGVKNIITTFVRDFNRHLADNLGDEFPDFRLASVRREENRSRDASTSSDEVPIHPGVFCDACHITIQGVRHKCLHCSNYDMCDVCVVTRRDRHNAGHTFAQIERPGAPPCVVSTAPAASTSQASPPPEEVERKAVHSSVVCDVCDLTVIGVRHKCLSCGNYDMCENCIAARRDAHDMSHVFAQIVRPGAAPAVVTVRSQSTAGAPTSSSIYNADAQHPATCDRCQGSIRGVRFKCLQCPDWDACSACHDGLKLNDVHPGHSFVPIYDPKLFTTRYNGVTPAHHEGIACDACEVGPIVGARYRCMHPDCNEGDSYDLCATCEADPIARHPIDHPLLKLRTPMGPTPENHRVVKDIIELVQRHLAASSNANASISTPKANPASPEEVPIAVAAIGKVVANVMRKWGIEVADDLPTTLLDGPGPEEDAAASSEDDAVEAHEESSAPMAMSQVDMAGAYPNQTSVVEAEKVAEMEITIEPSNEQTVEKSEEVAPVAEEEQVKVANATSADDTLRASFVADVTLSDGSLVPSGAMFTKIWHVMNSGNVTWPASARLVNVGGFTRMRSSTSSAALEFSVPIAQPGETVELSCELQAPEDEGKYMDHWRLRDQATQDFFGDRFWVAIVVESAHASSENSLTSSSFIAPAPETNRASTETDTRSTVSSVSSDELSNPEEDEEFIHAGVPSDENISGDEHDVESVVDEDEEFVVLSDEDFEA
ncbi:BQ5605_C001g00555 [Microbotryum silenes-dioicae]|uniref:BQ5605_C001g00555 protein n=1 Tax=Microbotryum silenes-dioicae TaxID=796604 RepID=A0A2X0P650_9BASI|nr:BQ5605_C001g00555 [Microbotryum silenes-dioicae]